MCEIVQERLPGAILRAALLSSFIAQQPLLLLLLVLLCAVGGSRVGAQHGTVLAAETQRIHFCHLLSRWQVAPQNSSNNNALFRFVSFKFLFNFVRCRSFRSAAFLG